jgi:hypothetical protein
MTSPSPSRPTIGGGAPIARALRRGTIRGGVVGQPTIGFLAGLAIGVVAALLIWRSNR